MKDGYILAGTKQKPMRYKLIIYENNNTYDSATLAEMSSLLKRLESGILLRWPLDRKEIERLVDNHIIIAEFKNISDLARNYPELRVGG